METPLFAHLEAGIPGDWFVLLTTNRDLYAKWFYKAIQALHWHPFMWNALCELSDAYY
ncbi:MAG: hypothetical protein AAGA75_18130 [Cyanobacteria bacterium P01_E01_bin.6]